MYITLYLYDKRTGNPPVYWCATSEDVSIAIGPEGDRMAARYPWLFSGRPAHGGDGQSNLSASLTALPSLGSITFIAMFPADDAGVLDAGHYALAPIDVSDLTLAVVYHDVDDNGGWAYRALG